MVRTVTALFFFCSFFSCKEEGKEVAIPLPQVKNDTFDFYYEEDHIPIVKGFSVDTIRYYEKATDYTQELICPEITGNEFNRINGKLKKEVQRKMNLDYSDTLDKRPIDTSEEIMGINVDNILLKMYKNKSLISYGFLSISTEPGRMRPFRRYFTVNYDTTRQRFIHLSDYLKIWNAGDSALVKSIIYGEVGLPESYWYTLTDKINFSSDKENVYFYFDMFGEFGNPYGLVKRVKKKYLNNYISNEYK